MSRRITTFAFDGVEARPVDVQVQAVGGLPHFALVGLPDKAVVESRERVRAAFAALGLALPPKRLIVNLAPADLPKEGSHFDLAIALVVLCAMGVIGGDALDGHAAIGELALDGRIGPVTGALPAAMAAEALGMRLLCPSDSASEAAWAGGTAIGAASLMALINHFSGRSVLPAAQPGPAVNGAPGPDLRDVKGQEGGKRVLEIAAAGGHNLLFCGPPGSGKSMLAARLPGLLPPLSARELLEVSQIQSVAGLLERGRLSSARPFRSPHHSASMPALVGGGVRARPGEVSLAHHGVLFLDELPEFSPQVLDSLRQPLETGEAVVSRANRHVRYPARFQLVAAMNPCRCGGGVGAAACRRGPRCAQDYQSRLSGPFLDRIDLFFDTPPVTAVDLALPPAHEGSAQVAARVAGVREVQSRRYRDAQLAGRRPVNADAHAGEIDQYCRPDTSGADLLQRAAVSLSLTARGYHRVLKIARTLADLDGQDGVRRVHIAEALSYRRREPEGQAAVSPVGSVNASFRGFGNTDMHG